MGPIDYIDHPTPISLSAGLSDLLAVHLPPIQTPGLEELLEDQLEDPQAGARPITLGPVDVVMTSDEARRYFDI